MTDSASSAARKPELEAVFRDLGQPTAEFKPATGNIIAGLIVNGGALLLGLAAMAGGFCMAALHGFDLPFFGPGKNQPDWCKVIVLGLGGVSAALFGGVMLPIKWKELSARIVVCPGGFVNAGKSIDVFAWDDIEKVVQDYAEAGEERSSDGPPMTNQTTFLVKRKGGGEFGFGRDSLRQYRRFARLLFAAARTHNIPWEFYVPR